MIDYPKLGKEIGELVQSKQRSYGDSFGKAGEVLKLLYPDGVEPEQYGDMLTVTRILDKLFRIATDRDALGESPWHDIVGYGLLALGKLQPPPTLEEQQEALLRHIEEHRAYVHETEKP